MVSKILERSGLTQAQLARRAGMPRSVVNVYAKGKRDPGANTLARLAAAGGLQLELVKREAPVDPYRAGRILVEVLELAEALPYSPKSELRFPPLKKTIGRGGRG